MIADLWMWVDDLVDTGKTSAVLLVCVGVLATLAVLSKRYQDNLMECIGLSLIALFCLLRAPVRWEAGATEGVNFILHIGLFCFAIGWAQARCYRKNSGA